MIIRKATTGIKMELLIKSKKSKIDMPNGLILDQSPKPREDGIPSRTLTPKVRNAALRRDRLVLSRMMETTVSIREIEEVKAANNTRRKKIAPIAVPNGMPANTFGKVINISPDPACIADSSPPEKRYTAGIIIKPAINAMPVSKISICWTA